MSMDEAEDFSVFSNMPGCAIVKDLNWTKRCEYISSSEECEEHVGYVNYLGILYCGFQPETDTMLWFCTAVLMTFIVVCFMFLSISADRFFCPALKVLSKAMGMNEHLAGVTLLAFGNGSPDLFTGFAGLNDESRLLYSDLFGAGLLVMTFVAGTICFLHPFRLQPNNILRDGLFFILGILYIEVSVVTDTHVTMLEACVVLGIYVSYMTVVMLDQFLLKRCVEDLTARATIHPDLFGDKLTTYRGEADLEYKSRASQFIDLENTRRHSYIEENAGKNAHLFRQFLESINPIEKEDWQESNLFWKGVQIIKIPINLFLLVLIPISDYELSGHGWSKLLNCLQLVWMPLVLFYLGGSEITVFNIPICLLTLIVTVPFSVIVFFTTRTDRPPSYHLLFAIISICGSCFIIYACAGETVNVLYVLGLISNCSSAFLGVTLLAWGNSLGDLVANTALASQGYEKMAFAACIAGPLFNSMLAMGFTFFYRAYAESDGDSFIRKGATGDNCFIFLIITLNATLLWAISTDFWARRSIGIFHIIIYVIFNIYAVLGEFEIIQTYAAETQSGFN